MDKLPTVSRKHCFPFYTNNEYFNFVADQWSADHKFSIEVHQQENTLWEHVQLRQPKVVIFAAEEALFSSGIIKRLAAVANRPTIVSLVSTPSEALLTECYSQGSDRALVVPYCSARIFQALLGRLVGSEHNYLPYRISSTTQTITFGDSEVRLHKKTFDVAQYLFAHHGKLISKSRILQDLWGLDSGQCLTRRIEVHISRLRRLLALNGSHGWEVRVRKSVGYGIFRKAGFNA